jgi:hypothetical protein
MIRTRRRVSLDEMDAGIAEGATAGYEQTKRR